MTSKPSTEPTVIDEAYMERFDNEQLAYTAWIGTDLAVEVLFDDEAHEDSLHDARFEVAQAAMALRVLVRRFTGMNPDVLRAQVTQRHLELCALRDDVEQLPAWETLQ